MRKTPAVSPAGKAKRKDSQSTTPPDSPSKAKMVPAAGVFVEEAGAVHRQIPFASTGVTAFVGLASRGPYHRAVQIRQPTEFQTLFGAPARHDLGHAVSQFFLNGGQTIWVVRTTRKPNLVKCQAALDQLATLNLLAFPGLTHLPLLPGAIEYAENRRSFFLIDPPGAVRTPDQMLHWIRQLDLQSSNAACYFPRVHASDPAASSSLPIAPSGSVAGLMARLDRTQGVWKAPAGKNATLAGITGLDYATTTTDIARLGEAAVNCLRVMPGAGPVIWGARTLASDAEFKYVPVRRLALQIEVSLRRGLKWAVFEPNGEPLWNRIRKETAEFLHRYFLSGALVGARADQAYFVRCGTDTMTQADRDAGVIRISVGFAPIKPAEFVILRLQLSQRSGEREGSH